MGVKIGYMWGKYGVNMGQLWGYVGGNCGVMVMLGLLWCIGVVCWKG